MLFSEYIQLMLDPTKGIPFISYYMLNNHPLIAILLTLIQITGFMALGAAVYKMYLVKKAHEEIEKVQPVKVRVTEETGSR